MTNALGYPSLTLQRRGFHRRVMDMLMSFNHYQLTPCACCTQVRSGAGRLEN
jgi:hypothetical protein